MNRFSALTLRLFIGSIFGFAITLAISYFMLNSSNATSSVGIVYLLLLGPLALMLALGFLVPGWIQNHRWKTIWKPRAEGRLPVPAEKRETILFKGVRELTGAWVMPGIARTRLEDYLTSWARTLVRNRVHDPILWEVLALCWYKIKTDKDFLRDVRSILMELDTLDDASFDLGLSLLTERETDVDLAILLAQEGLGHDLENIAPERHVLLENAWLAAYAKDEELRPHLLPILTRRFLAVQRRDEVSGRIYLDAFIAGERAGELRDEMKRTADVLARTGRSPEMTANLRALADSGKDAADDGEVGTILRAPSRWSASTNVGKKPVGKKKAKEAPQQSHREPVETEPTSISTGKGRGLWLTLLIILMVMVLGGGSYYFFFMQPNQSFTEEHPTLVPVEQPLTPPGKVESDQPYTIQIAAIQSENDAVARIQALRNQGIDAYYVQIENDEATWYRIRLGRFSSTREATIYADSLRTTGVIQEYFVDTFKQGVVPEAAVN
ncbi:SPOR domain-containing protein [bacterium]|nr:SPOR domain-containing protein [bacterium]